MDKLPEKILKETQFTLSFEDLIAYLEKTLKFRRTSFLAVDHAGARVWRKESNSRKFYVLHWYKCGSFALTKFDMEKKGGMRA